MPAAVPAPAAPAAGAGFAPGPRVISTELATVPPLAVSASAASASVDGDPGATFTRASRTSAAAGSTEVTTMYASGSVPSGCTP